MLSEDRRDVSSIIFERGYVVRVNDVGCYFVSHTARNDEN